MPRRALKKKKNVVVVGASAGGVEALKAVIAGLTAEFTGIMFVVLHVPAEQPSQLREILQTVSRLPVVSPLDGEEVTRGHIYVASSNHHLLLEDRKIRVTLGPKENRFRPSVDALFRSAALAYGTQVVGVVVSGCLDDGAAGLFAIKRRHGTAVVQTPGDALHDGMPRHALQAVDADYVLPAIDIGPLLQRLSEENAGGGAKMIMDKQMEAEVGISLGDGDLMRQIMALGKFTPFTCPECHGALVEIKESQVVRFRCHTGHAFTLSHLLAEVTKANEDSLINALRSIEETLLLLDRVKDHLKDSRRSAAARLLKSRIDLVKEQAGLVKKASLKNEVLSEDSFGL